MKTKKRTYDKTKIDIGCGAYTKEGFMGLDLMPNGSNPYGLEYNKTDLVCDLNKGIPLKSNTIKEVYSGHFFEHIDNVKHLVDEIYRVCIDGALLEIVVPINEYFTPDHKTVFFPGWSKRFFDLERFEIKEVQTREKTLQTHTGMTYDIFEQSVFIIVKK